MSFGPCEISTSIKDATISDLIHANKNIRILKAEKISLQFPDLGSIVCYSDASFASFRNASSQGAYMFLFKDEKKFAPISWKSKKIQGCKEYSRCRDISASGSLRGVLQD